MNLKDLIEDTETRKRESERLAILQLIQSNPKITREEIVNKTGYPRRLVNNRIEDLMEKGLLILERRWIILTENKIIE